MQSLLAIAPRAMAVTVDARYRGQSHETNVAYIPGTGADRLRRDFAAAHQARNGFVLEGGETEVVTIRVAATSSPTLTWDQLTFQPEGGDPQLGNRTLPDGSRAGRWWRPRLGRGDEVVGPALIEEPEATTFIDLGERALVLSDGTVEITW
jgi:N-methylhydantoinase A